MPDTGHLDSDLRALAREIVASLQRPAIWAALGSIVAAAIQDQVAQGVLSEFIAARVATMTVIVQRTGLRGDLGSGVDAAEVLQTVIAQIFYRVFIAGEQPSASLADRAAAATTAAAAARARADRAAATDAGAARAGTSSHQAQT